jgi:hypothetical protein
MHVSREFLREFAYLANLYKWTPSDIEEIKQATRISHDLKKYWEILAKAHHAGYEQTENNCHIRLYDWCIENGRMDLWNGIEK